jgi:hypothetical protein
MSAQGLRETHDGVEKIADRAELMEIRRKGRAALTLSVIATFVSTGPFIAV